MWRMPLFAWLPPTDLIVIKMSLLFVEEKNKTQPLNTQWVSGKHWEEAPGIVASIHNTVMTVTPAAKWSSGNHCQQVAAGQALDSSSGWELI